MAPRRKAGTTGGRGLTPAALSRVIPGGRKGYRDPRTGKQYTAREIRGAKRALGITPQITDALKRRGFGIAFADQVRAAQQFRQTQGAGARRARRDAGADLVKSLEVALQTRDSLGALVASFQRAERQAGRRITRAQALRPGSRLWAAITDLSAPREIIRGGKARKVKAKSLAARALVTLGLRPSWATWRVGDSPSLERVNQFLGRNESASWGSLSAAQRARVNAATVEGGALARPSKSDHRPAETAALAAVGRRAANDPRRNER